ncbi:hypothetical protein ACFV6D_21975 [Kitasatospora sp. NPDC059812]|uniref:hypothetical protein n=1 Tax=Kitasatospora sp. NPDC059812 TaxID=3346958 RepID=UPI003661BF49
MSSDKGWQDFPEGAVPGWRASATDHLIEIRNGQLRYGKVPPDSGKQYAELNANEPSSLYQDVRTIPGSVMRWKIAHRGRQGVDVMRVRIGAPTGELVAQVPEKAKSPDLADGKTAWGHYEGFYTVPEGQTVTRFAAASVSTFGNDPRRGNLVDSLSFVTGPVVSVTKTVAGAQDQRGVAVGDELTYTVKAVWPAPVLSSCRSSCTSRWAEPTSGSAPGSARVRRPTPSGLRSRA